MGWVTVFFVVFALLCAMFANSQEALAGSGIFLAIGWICFVIWLVQRFRNRKSKAPKSIPEIANLKVFKAPAVVAAPVKKANFCSNCGCKIGE